MYDLIVIGGGPAGTSAAIHAVQGGARVLLLERGRFPRQKVCGEFVSAESLGLLESLLDPRSQHLLREAVSIPQVRVFLDGRTLRAKVDPPAASIARFDLDAALWSSAQHAGIDARQAVTAHSIAGTGPFRIVTSAGEFEGRALVNASGRWSNLNTAPSNGAGHEKCLGLKAHFAEPAPEASVDLYFFEGGYCGVQPVSLQDGDSHHGRVNACAMVRADAATTLPEVFALHPALRERSGSWQPLGDPVSTSPLIFQRPRPARDSILMVGDAAGFVDPFVGDGISLALRSGRLAAQSLGPYFAGATSLHQAVHEYCEVYEESLLPVFRTSSWIRQALRLPRVARRPVLSVLEKSPALTQRLMRSTR
jgi:flavin-dependent dehydrogenase